jgi:hypothetical protein
LADKVARAADRYQIKFGRRPNLCYVHSSMLESGAVEFDGVRLVPVHNVLKHHFWIGVEEAAEMRKAA